MRARPLRAHAGLILACSAWLLWVASFNKLDFGVVDAWRPYSLLRELFGEEPVTNHLSGYQFGLALLWVPFYGVGKLLAGIGVETIGGEPAGVAAVALGTSLLVVATCAVLLPVLRGLRLPRPATALVLGVFGTPLAFHGTFQVGLSHVADTFLLTAIIALLFVYLRSGTAALRLPFAMGVLAGYGTTIRYFGVFEVGALVLGLALCRRYRAGLTVAVASALTFLVLVTIPLLVGVKSLIWGWGGGTTVGEASGQAFGFAPENPILMLFSNRAGLFVWTPLALLGVLGYILLVRNRPEHRAFLLITAGLTASILLPFAGVSFWIGFSGFSNRYLTPVFPLVVMGLAALIEHRPRMAVPAATLCCAWSIFLSFNATLGVPLDAGAWGLPSRMLRGEVTPGDWMDAVYHRSRLLPHLLPDPVDHR